MNVPKDLDKMSKDNGTFKSWIENIKKLNDTFDEFLKTDREEWNKNLEPLFQKITHKSADELMELQALALSRRQMLVEKIATYMNKLSKETISFKQAEADRFLFYMTGFGIKTNTGEKKILFDAELAELERNMQLLQTHIEFLRDCKLSCDNVGWAIKNRIALMGILEN